MMRRQRHDELTDAQIEAIVAEALASERSDAHREATPPSAAVVWWRAQMRARQEAARLADKPIVIVHAVAIACGLGVALTLAGIVLTAVRGSFGWFTDLYAGAATAATSLATTELSSHWVTLSLTAALVSLVIASVAALFVLADE